MGIDQLGFQSVQLGPSAITAQWFSDTTDQLVTTPMIALYLSGTTHLSADHNVALSQYATSTDLTRHRNYSPFKIATLLVTFNTAGTSLELNSKSSRTLGSSFAKTFDQHCYFAFLSSIDSGHLNAHAMSLFELQDVCMAIESPATLDLPMIVDLVGIFEMKGPYCTLTMIDWFLQALSVIPRGSWGDVARRFIMILWHPPTAAAVASHHCRVLPTSFWPSWQGESVRDNSLCFLVQGNEGIWKPVMDWIRRTIGDSTVEVLFPCKIGIFGAGREVVKGKYFYACLAFVLIAYERPRT
ncbi:archaeal ATPase [Dorcoceras hygrometricum]|uniref:Archaeal ATPase n=1 Tax=Dorcoceras hygrometricum TaxID=472368 RepID=A0A2Z7B4B6_9LAMI|nr:archaeal ATPase [Dorcoceras hygrometricum]